MNPKFLPVFAIILLACLSGFAFGLFVDLVLS